LNRIKTAFIITSIYLVLIITRCGIYSFSGSTIPSHIKTINVPLFEDKTAEFGIDQQLTDAVIDGITKDNTLKISGPRGGDSVLKGIIVNVREQAGQYDQQERASDYRIFITVRVTFEDVKKRKTLWEEEFSEWGRYEGVNRDDGIKEAVEKLKEVIINRLVSGW